MPVRELASEVGDPYRYQWNAEDGSRRFGLEGELLESKAPHHETTSEPMIGRDGPAAVDELTLSALEAGMPLTLILTYPGAEVRDTALATGMTGGMRRSYARLEEQVLPAAPV